MVVYRGDIGLVVETGVVRTIDSRWRQILQHVLVVWLELRWFSVVGVSCGLASSEYVVVWTSGRVVDVWADGVSIFLVSARNGCVHLVRFSCGVLSTRKVGSCDVLVSSGVVHRVVVVGP